MLTEWKNIYRNNNLVRDQYEDYPNDGKET